MVTYEYDLDVVPRGVPVVVPVKQYEDDAEIVLHVYSRRATLVVPTGSTAFIRGTKPDGNVYSANIELENFGENTVDAVVDVTKQMTAVQGRALFEVVFTYQQAEIITASFVLDVVDAAMDLDSIQSESILRELQDKVDNAYVENGYLYLTGDGQVIAGPFQMSGTFDHSALENRSEDDQHPISAITGLEEALEDKQDALTAGNNVTIVNNVISAESTAKFSYGASTYEDVDAAYNDGKSCEMVKIEDDGSLVVAKLMYGYIDEDIPDGSYYLFVTITAEGQIVGYYLWSDDLWAEASFTDDPYYQKAALVTSLTASSDHNHYPSAKAVYDALQSAGGGNVLVAEYNSTTFATIQAAYNAGKAIFVYRSGYLGYMTRFTSSKVYFTYVYEGTPTSVTCTSANAWMYYSIPLLRQTVIVTELSAASDDTHVPSAKCVYDAIQSAGGGWPSGLPLPTAGGYGYAESDGEPTTVKTASATVGADEGYLIVDESEDGETGAPTDWHIGDILTVTINGVTYRVPLRSDGEGSWDAGAARDEDDFYDIDWSEYNFLVHVSWDEDWYENTTVRFQHAGTYDVSMTVVNETVHQIDEKFIPNAWPSTLPLPSSGGYGYTTVENGVTVNHPIDAKYLPTYQGGVV